MHETDLNYGQFADRDGWWWRFVVYYPDKGMRVIAEGEADNRTQALADGRIARQTWEDRER